MTCHWDGTRIAEGPPPKVQKRFAAPLEELTLKHLLSVDPGANSAWALWSIQGCVGTLTRIDKTRVREDGAYSPPTAVECLKLLGDLSAALGVDWSKGHVAVEGQYYAPHREGGAPSSPWTDVERIIESRCAWQDAARIIGAEVSTIPPSIWIRQMTKGLTGRTSKDRIKVAVKTRFPGVAAVSDEFDAILLGSWWLEEQGLVPRLGTSRFGG